MSEIVQLFSRSRRSGFLLKLNNFRSNMRHAFDAPIKSVVSETASSMKAIYLNTLDRFIEGKYYFGSRRDYTKLGKSMIIWRIPVSIPNISIGICVY